MAIIVYLFVLFTHTVDITFLLQPNYFLYFSPSAPGAVVESSTTTVTRKQQEFTVSGEQTEQTLAAVESSAPQFLQPLPGNMEVEEGSTVRLVIICVCNIQTNYMYSRHTL